MSATGRARTTKAPTGKATFEEILVEDVDVDDETLLTAEEEASLA